MIKLFFILLFGLLHSQNIDQRYHTTEEIYNYLDSLNNLEAINNWFHIDTIGFSTNDTIPILSVRISDNASLKEDEPRVLFIGQVHAEEILGVEIVMDLIDKLLFPNVNSYSHMQILKENIDIHLIPTLNPEGLNIVHDGYDVSFRKNKRDFSPDGPYPNGIFDYEPSIGNDIDGVDLNRNFSFNWIFGDTFLEPDNSDYASHYDYFRGTSPFSENEAAVLRDLALENNFVFSIVWHSSRSGNLSEKIFTSWKWEGLKPSPDLEIMKGIGDAIGSLLVKEDGTGTYLSAYSESRNGKLHDWFYRETGCFQYLIECGTSNLQPDSSLVEDTIDRSRPAMIYLMNRILGYNASSSQVTGIVYSSNLNTPIVGAVIEVAEHSGNVLRPRLSDEFGRYRRLLNPGTYNLILRAEGYKTKEISVRLIVVYSTLTLACALIYKLFGMNIFDSITHSMTTIATGGFSNYNESIGYFNNSYIEFSSIVFILLGSIPFIAYIKFLNGDKNIFFTDIQIKGFIKIIIFSVIILIFYLFFENKILSEVRVLSIVFNVVSILTGTGYVTENFSLWGNFSSIFFLILMFIGGCAGSTACGIKIFRIQILYLFILNQLKKIIYPRGIFVVKYDKSNINEKSLSSVISFIYLYIIIFFIITALLSLSGLNFITSISAAATAISNVGPGLGDLIGPNGNFSALTDFSKWILSFAMILGRLELFAILILFVPSFWKKY